MSLVQAGCICVNGRLCEPGRATVSALDAGFLLGDGLFESLRAGCGEPYLLERHLRRLFTAAAALEFTGMPSPEAIAEQVRRTLWRAALPDAYVRITVSRGAGGVGLAPPGGPPTVVIAALPAQPLAPTDSAIAAALLRGTRARRVAAKSTSWQPAVVAKRRVERCGADEGLYVSASGNVLEGVASNVFAVDGNRLLTPPARHCLPGITRGRVLELARANGLEALEAPLALDALMRAQEVFVTNAVQGLRALATVAGSAIGRQGAGGVFDTLHRLYALDRAGAGEMSD
jgi:branched-subunit amino acid aminotransferase/4-amino-4-deoxychorismate lyase